MFGISPATTREGAAVISKLWSSQAFQQQYFLLSTLVNCWTFIKRKASRRKTNRPPQKKEVRLDKKFFLLPPGESVASVLGQGGVKLIVYNLNFYPIVTERKSLVVAGKKFTASGFAVFLSGCCSGSCFGRGC